MPDSCGRSDEGEAFALDGAINVEERNAGGRPGERGTGVALDAEEKIGFPQTRHQLTNIGGIRADALRNPGARQMKLRMERDERQDVKGVGKAGRRFHGLKDIAVIAILTSEAHPSLTRRPVHEIESTPAALFAVHPASAGRSRSSCIGGFPKPVGVSIPPPESIYKWLLAIQPT